MSPAQRFFRMAIWEHSHFYKPDLARTSSRSRSSISISSISSGDDSTLAELVHLAQPANVLDKVLYKFIEACGPNSFTKWVNDVRLVACLIQSPPDQFIKCFVRDLWQKTWNSTGQSRGSTCSRTPSTLKQVIEARWSLSLPWDALYILKFVNIMGYNYL